MNPHTPLRHLLALNALDRATLERLLERADRAAPARTHRRPRPATAGRAHHGQPVLRALHPHPHLVPARAARLGAEVVNFDMATSSARKGETIADTLRTLEAMGVSLFAVRHAVDGAVAALVADCAPSTRLINAGDGRSHHPTQGLLEPPRRHPGPATAGLCASPPCASLMRRRTSLAESAWRSASS
jgi:aspartate carbamoyltransferase catalytic subunit